MLRVRILYACIALFISGKAFSQVNLQTGSAVFSLPMFSWQDDKSRLNSIVALSYNSGNGLKVNEVASFVGQGWNLVAGGAISRVQVGEPDDQLKYDGLNGSGSTEKDITKYPAGRLYATVPVTNGCPVALTKYPIYHDKNQLYKQHNIMAEDKQLDYFTFNFNGKAGMFILDPSGNGQGISLGDTKMKITFQLDAGQANNESTRTTISSFSIQDVDGLIYRFTIKGKSKIFEYDYCDPGTQNRWVASKLKQNHIYHQAAFVNNNYINPWVTGSWWLSEVEDPLTHRKVTFTYETSRIITDKRGYDITVNETSEHNYALIAHKTSETEIPQLLAINYPDGHVVTFTYSDKMRVDLASDQALSAVSVTYNGRYLSKYLLNTTYVMKNMYGNPESVYEKNIARLYLKSVQKIGPDLKEDSPPYIFDYYLGSGIGDDFVPPPYFWAKDIWGYYNGDLSRDYNGSPISLDYTIEQLTSDNQHYSKLLGLCFLRSGSGSAVELNAKAGYAKKGLLKQIIYPTGGTLEYEYDQNSGTFYNESTVNTIGGVHVSKTISTDGGYSNKCKDLDPDHKPITTSYNYVNSDGASSFWGLERPINNVGYASSTHYEREDRHRKITFTSIIAGGFTCRWNYQYPGILSMSQAIQLSWVQQNLMPVINTVLGIVSIVTTVMDIVTLVGSSTVIWSWVAVIVDILGSLITVIIECLDGAKTVSSTTYYNFDLNSANPLPAQFKRIEVTESPGTSGKTVHEFTSLADFPLWETLNPNLSAKQRFAPWAYGLPKRITVYDQNGINIVREILNTYDPTYIKHDFCVLDECPECRTGEINEPLASGDSCSPVSYKCVVKGTTSQRSDSWTNPAIYTANYQTGSTAEMAVESYVYYTGRVQLLTSKERTYSTVTPGQFTEVQTNYFYNSYNNYEVNRINITQSDGTLNEKTIKYTSDYTSGINYTLAQNNIIAQPVQTTSFVWKGSSGYTTNIKETQYISIANGDIKPSTVTETRRLSLPSNLSTPVVTQTFTYDSYGNLTGLKDEGNRQVTNIYDYNDKYIAASVINADPVADKPAYTSFETDDYSRSGWTVTGTHTYNTTLSITGTSSFILSSGKSFSKTGLNTARAYLLSFWATSPLTVSAGAALKKSAPVINGFTYYEYDIAAGTASVTISGSGTIDELRLYPKNARMRTITYDPVMGKTSECDENNRIIYYEYDNLGRLRFIKDENKNITKMYEYNNVSGAKQNGCPVAYSNNLITEYFRKNTCSSNQQGTDVPVTVAAGTYTSAISQADADAKAQNYLLEHGQEIANTTGSCQTIYYNTLLSQDFTTQGCSPGYKGAAVTYTVPAGKYSSLDPGIPDELAQDEIDANGQYNANFVNPSCIIDTDPDWVWNEGDPSYCLSVDGQLPPHLFLYVKDMNPNSSTYNQQKWADVGTDDACPANTYYNAEKSQSFTRNNCNSGYTGGTVTYTVPPGTYSSTASQAAADQLAQNDINANGQNYANAHGTCTATCSFTAYSPPFEIITSSISNSSGTVQFYIVFYPNVQPMNLNIPYQVATINGLCLPSAGRSFTTTWSGRTFNVSITTSGILYVTLTSGTSIPLNTSIYITGSYSL